MHDQGQQGSAVFPARPCDRDVLMLVPIGAQAGEGQFDRFLADHAGALGEEVVDGPAHRPSPISTMPQTRCTISRTSLLRSPLRCCARLAIRLIGSPSRHIWPISSSVMGGLFDVRFPEPRVIVMPPDRKSTRLN